MHATQMPRVEMERYGACPVCAGHDGCLNVGRYHWFRCDSHKTKWLVGEDLFAYWREQPAQEWRAAGDMLAAYQEVEPLHRACAPGQSTATRRSQCPV